MTALAKVLQYAARQLHRPTDFDRRWYRDAGFIEVTVEYGVNGVVGRGRRPVSA